MFKNEPEISSQQLRGASLARWRRNLIAVAVAAGSIAGGGNLLGQDQILRYDLTNYFSSSASAFAPATTVGPGLTAEPLTRGPGINPASLERGFSTNRWTNNSDHPTPTVPTRATALANGDYFEFSLTVQPGFTASLATLDHSMRRSAAGAASSFEWQYSFDGFATPGQTLVPLGTQWDSFGWQSSHFTYLGRATTTGTASNFNYMTSSTGAQGGGNQMPTFELSTFWDLQNIPGGTTVTFRLYGWGADQNSRTVALGCEVDNAFGGPMITGTVVPAGEVLTIVSHRPGTNPEPGVYSHAPGTQITASAPLEVAQDGYVHRLTGWTGTGSVPARGSENTVTFFLTEASTLEWQWEEMISPIVQYDMIGSGNVVLDTFAATTVATGLTAAPLSRGAGPNPTNLTRGFSSNEWSMIPWGMDGREVALTADDYYEFAFTVAEGYVASLAALDHALRRSAVSAPMFYEWQYSFDNFATPGNTVIPRGQVWEMLAWNTPYFTYHGRSAIEAGGVAGTVDNYNYITERVDGQNEGNPIPTFDLTQEPLLQEIAGGTTVTFRLYAWGNDQTTPTNSAALGRDNADQVGGPRLAGSVRAAGGARLAILSVSREDNSIVLAVDNPSGAVYRVERSFDLINWDVVATEQTGSIWSGPVPVGANRVFWRLAP
jgi:hypothetical protein